MVASVGPSYNVLSLFQKQDGAAAADTTAVDAIIDQIQQMKTDASAARLQGASAATQAWIESSDAASSVATAEAQPDVTPVAASTVAGGRQLAVSPGPDGIFNGVTAYNAALKSLWVNDRYLTTVKEQVATESDASKTEYLNNVISLVEKTIARNNYFLSNFSADMAAAIKSTEDGYKISGSIFETNEDGTLRFGVFSITAKGSGMTYWQHDGSGTAIRSNNVGEAAYAFDLTTWHETPLKPE